MGSTTAGGGTAQHPGVVEADRPANETLRAPRGWARPRHAFLISLVGFVPVFFGMSRPGSGLLAGQWFLVVPLVLTGWTVLLWSEVVGARKAVWLGVGQVVALLVLGGGGGWALWAGDGGDDALFLLVSALVLAVPLHAFVAFIAAVLAPSGRMARAVAIAGLVFAALHATYPAAQWIGLRVLESHAAEFVADVRAGRVEPQERYRVGPYSYDSLCPGTGAVFVEQGFMTVRLVSLQADGSVTTWIESGERVGNTWGWCVRDFEGDALD